MTIPDGYYFLHFEGSAWSAIEIRHGTLQDESSEADHATHVAAKDEWCDIAPNDDTDIEVTGEMAKAICKLYMGDESDQDTPRVFRPNFDWRLEMCDDGGADETKDFDDEEPSEDEIEESCRDWVNEREWGDDGCIVNVWWTLRDEAMNATHSEGSLAVTVDADHEALIRKAVGHTSKKNEDRAVLFCGDKPDDHTWTSEGEGGCTENPGVWATGGTTIVSYSHCRICGLYRTHTSLGSQRNPGACDTTKYEMPPAWCRKCQREQCEHTGDIA